jgi:hypothetical protein
MDLLNIFVSFFSYLSCTKWGYVNDKHIILSNDIDPIKEFNLVLFKVGHISLGEQNWKYFFITKKYALDYLSILVCPTH